MYDVLKRPRLYIVDESPYPCEPTFKSTAWNECMVNGKHLNWNRTQSTTSRFRRPYDRERNGSSSRSRPNQVCQIKNHTTATKCWIDSLPQELLLKIFGYLPLRMLLHTLPQVCRKWETLALDWTLWKTVENLTINNMVISTAKLKTLLRTIPKLKKLELILR